MAEEAGRPAGGSTLDSLRALGATLLEALGTRVELAVVELREEAERRKRMLVLALVAAVFLGLALVAGSLFVIVLFWDTHRLAAAAGVTLFHAAVGIAALLALRRLVDTSPPPFQTTLAELARDRDMLGRREAP